VRELKISDLSAGDTVFVKNEITPINLPGVSQVIPFGTKGEVYAAKPTGLLGPQKTMVEIIFEKYRGVVCFSNDYAVQMFLDPLNIHSWGMPNPYEEPQKPHFK
jgi:hypothetical protein